MKILLGTFIVCCTQSVLSGWNFGKLRNNGLFSLKILPVLRQYREIKDGVCYVSSFFPVSFPLRIHRKPSSSWQQNDKSATDVYMPKHLMGKVRFQGLLAWVTWQFGKLQFYAFQYSKYLSNLQKVLGTVIKKGRKIVDLIFG